MKKCLHDIVRVHWVDADEESGWQTYTKKEPFVIHTIGYLVEKPKTKYEFIVLANSHLPDVDTWSGLNRIPKGMVLRVETLFRNVPCGKDFNANTCHTRHTNKARRTD